MKDFQQKNDQGKLSDKEWETLAQQLLNAKFDNDKQNEIKGVLAKNGIYRSRFIFNKNWIAIAASFLILIAASSYFFINNSSTPQSLALQHLEIPFEISEGGLRGQVEIHETRGKAIEAYDNHQFEKSLAYLQEIEIQGKNEIEDYFLMGLCLIYKSNPDYENALTAFEQVSSLDQSTYANEINWLSGLCHIMLGAENKAKDFLQKVTKSPSSRKNKEAQLILEKIK